MSSIARWSYQHGPATVWPLGGRDEFNQPIQAEPYLIPAVNYQGGGEISAAADGTQFTPRETFGFEAEVDDPIVPKREWRIKWGDHLSTARPPADAFKIETVEFWPIDELEPGGIPDWQIKT